MVSRNRTELRLAVADELAMWLAVLEDLDDKYRADPNPYYPFAEPYHKVM